jgi:hypothetical protein
MLTPVSALPFQQFVPGIMTFLRQCWNDEERTDQFSVSTLGLIGDFGDTYKAAVREELMLYAQKVGFAVPICCPCPLLWEYT